MSPRTPNTTLFIAITAITITAAIAAAYWQMNTMNNASENVLKLRNEITNTESLKNKLTQAQVQLMSTLQTLEHLETGVASREIIPTLLKNLEETGTACGLDITGVRPIPVVEQKKTANTDKNNEQQKQKRKPYQELDVEVKCRGSFDNVMSFIQKLESFPKIVGVQSISVTPRLSRDGRNVDHLDATLTLRMYVFPTDIPSVPKNFDSAQLSEGETNNVG